MPRGTIQQQLDEMFRINALAFSELVTDVNKEDNEFGAALEDCMSMDAMTTEQRDIVLESAI